MRTRAAMSLSRLVFLVTEAVGKGQIDAMLDVFSRDRSGAAQPIAEVRL